jgi:hypothetical protein
VARFGVSPRTKLPAQAALNAPLSPEQYRLPGSEPHRRDYVERIDITRFGTMTALSAQLARQGFPLSPEFNC